MRPLRELCEQTILSAFGEPGEQIPDELPAVLAAAVRSPGCFAVTDLNEEPVL